MTDKTFKDYLKEDAVDQEKHDALNNIAMTLGALETEIAELARLDGDMDSSGVGDLTDQLTTMRKLVNSFEAVIDRATGVVPMESVNEGGMKQAEIEVQDWANKYNDYMGVNGDELANGYLQAMLNTGIMSDAFDQDEYIAFNEKNGYEDDGDWSEDDHDKFMQSSPITRGMFSEIRAIQDKYGIDEQGVNDIMGYFESVNRMKTLAGLGNNVYDPGKGHQGPGGYVDRKTRMMQGDNQTPIDFDNIGKKEITDLPTLELPMPDDRPDPSKNPSPSLDFLRRRAGIK